MLIREINQHNALMFFSVIFLIGCSNAAEEAGRERDAIQKRLAEVTAENARYKTVDMQLAASRKSVKELTLQVRDLEKAASIREDQIGHLTRQNTEFKQLLDKARAELTTLRPQALSANLKKETSEQRIELRRWIAERDSFRRQLQSVSNSGYTEAAEDRVKEMRKRALEVDSYKLAIAILEENKRILQEVHDRKVAFRKRVEDMNLGVKFKAIDDSLLQQVDEDLISVDRKFNIP